MHAIVVGGGAFGTAVASAVSGSGEGVTLLVREAQQARSINENQLNAKYLPDFRLPSAIRATTDLSILRSSAVVFLAMPSQAIDSTVHQLADHICTDSIVVNLAKGLHSQHFTLDELLSRALPSP